jgi:hypothetical protein
VGVVSLWTGFIWLCVRTAGEDVLSQNEQFGVFHVLWINQMYNIFNGTQQMQLDL